jgi:four helix bundle protein
MVYSLTSQGKLQRDYGLKDQIQRASVSVMANIAEGFGSRRNGEFNQFLSYSRRSAIEVQSLLYALLDAGYINTGQFKAYYEQAKLTIRLVTGFKSSLK